MIVIRKAEEGDFEASWRIFQRIFAKGDSYVCSELRQASTRPES
jgi:hypothetical protein